MLTAVLTALLLLSGCSEKDPYPQPTESFFVNDFADLLDDTAESTVVSVGAALEHATTAQVVAVTVETLDGKEPADYALELGRKWGVGDREKDNGIVVLLAKEERQIYVAVGYGLEGALPDSKTGRMIDYYALEKLQKDDFAGGITALYKALVNEVYLENGMEPEEGYIAAEQLPQPEEGGDWVGVLVSWLVMIVLIVIFTGISRRRGIFFSPFIGPFGGGFGGFSGGSGSGGFGGFSGGGGSFGGGGAGRGF